MMHTCRVWKLSPFTGDASELATALTEYSHTVCTGYEWRTLTILNDATGENGAQEYAVIRDGRQVESLTCSWMEAPKLAEILTELDNDPIVHWGDRDTYYKWTQPVAPNISHPAGTCPACA